MGYSCQAVCSDCGMQFSVTQGGGFITDVFHCEKCGAEKPVGRDAMTSGSALKPCSCGGIFSHDAPIRCPHCASTDWNELSGPDHPAILWD